MRYRHWIGIGASIILAAIFIIAGLGKLQQTEAFMIIFGLHRALLFPTLANHIDTWLPRLELALGLLLIAGIAAKLTVSFSSLLIAAFIFNNSWELAHGAGGSPCECFGVFEHAFGLSIAEALYLDIGMLALVAVILLCYPGSMRTIRPWFLRR